MQDPQPDFHPTPGEACPILPNLRRIVAPNPSPMTFRGTNTYLLGTDQIAVIDPGPSHQGHLKAILDARGDGQITHIFVTHSHVDHSPLARDLAQETGAPIHAFGASDAGRSDVMQRLAKTGGLGGGEGVDVDFQPDIALTDNEEISTPEWSLRALHTPGHMSNHLCFSWDNHLFSGDLVMGWASSLVSPPDGDLTAFMASCRRLMTAPWSTFQPGHGAPITNPAQRVQDLIAHRQGREQEILRALSIGADTACGITRKVYTDTPAALLGAAQRNVLAHLIDLKERNIVKSSNEFHEESLFERI